MKISFLTILLCLVGCADQRPVANNAPQTVSEPVPSSKPPVIESAPDMVMELRSINQSQQQQTGLITTQFQKVADVVDAAAVKVQTEVKAQADVNADLKAQVKASIEAVADLKAALNGQISAIAGLGNKIDSQQQTYSSGRDTTTTQFTDKMAETIMSGQRHMAYVIVLLVGAVTAIVIVYMEVRHRRGRVS